MGVSPYGFLTGLSMRRACDPLTEGGLSVSEVAERVGIDPRNSSGIFRRELGVSPAEYKK